MRANKSHQKPVSDWVLKRGEVRVATPAGLFVSFQSDLLITKNDRPIGNASHTEKRIKSEADDLMRLQFLWLSQIGVGNISTVLHGGRRRLFRPPRRQQSGGL